jgi:TolA protein
MNHELVRGSQTERAAQSMQSSPGQERNERRITMSLALALLLAAAPDDFQQYLDQIRKRIESNWKYPANSDDLQATVKFNLDRAGRVAELKIVKSSGRKNFDESVLDAVRAATPFPSLITMLKKSEVREVEMTFKRKSVVIEAPKATTPSKPLPKKP